MSHLLDPRPQPWQPRSQEEYDRQAEQQERQRRQRADRERWAFHGLLSPEEQAKAKVRAGRRWICEVEGHDWKVVGVDDEYETLQCYRCDDVRLVLSQKKYDAYALGGWIEDDASEEDAYQEQLHRKAMRRRRRERGGESDAHGHQFAYVPRLGCEMCRDCGVMKGEC